MAIYDATSSQMIESPDLSTGYLVEGTIITGYRKEVFTDTVTENRPNGIRKRVPVTEPCQYYHKYTEEELAAQHPPDETDESDLAARVQVLETSKANQTDVDELQEALDLILSGVTE